MDSRRLPRYSALCENRIYSSQSILHDGNTYLIAVQNLQSWNA
jgi:hypothetical protein